MQRVVCSSLISSARGEHLFNHIVFDETSFNVGKSTFFVDELGGVKEEIVETRKGSRRGLNSFDLMDVNAGVSQIPYTINEKDVVSLVFLQGPKRAHLDGLNKNRLRTNVRCPMPKAYWREIGLIERSREDVRTKKEDLKKTYAFEFNILNSGAKVVLPFESDSSSYLIALSKGGSFEWVLSRKSKYPNCYRITANEDGTVTLVDPRKEARESEISQLML